MAVYDVTNRASFEALGAWVTEGLKHCAAKGKGEPVGVLVATKTDQADFAQVTAQEALEFAHAHSLAFFETAAATGRDVDVPFNFIAAKFQEQYDKKIKEIQENIV